jgi:hypothetical protein
MSSAKPQVMDTTNSPKAKPGTSRTSNLLPQSVIESMRKQAKIDDQLWMETLAKQNKSK